MNDLVFARSPVSVKELEKIGEGRQAELFLFSHGVVKLFRRQGDHPLAKCEAAVMYALRTTGLPMPRIFGTVTIEGRPGIVMERLAGPDQLSKLGRKPWTIWSVATELARLHARLHATAAPDELQPLKALLRIEIGNADTVPVDCKERVFALLDRLPDETAVCHWDFHPGNVIETKEGPKVIDWIGVRCGAALADVARTLLILRGGALPPGAPFLVRTLTSIGRAVLVWRYLNAYRRLRPFEDSELEGWHLVSAASRLTYGITEEREQLLATLRA